MNLDARYKPYSLIFKKPVLTSRGEMKVKNGYWLFVSNGSYTATGECSFIEGLSIDNLATYEATLQRLCNDIKNANTLNPDYLNQFPSIAFGYQMAMLELEQKSKVLFPGAFTRDTAGIPINGLVWMGTKEWMQQQVEQKLKDGFKCIKIKVGAIDFDEELSLLGFIRSKFPKEVIEIRLDANGAFTETDVHEKLERLSAFHIHSIEQPVKPGQWQLMSQLCKNGPIPIALDEELIGIDMAASSQMLDTIQPSYIILKPSLLGGFSVCHHYIQLAEAKGIGWWATSALESNIGLSAIAQWVSDKAGTTVQGLGTGGLYQNNIASPLQIKNGQLYYNPAIDRWSANLL